MLRGNGLHHQYVHHLQHYSLAAVLQAGCGDYLLSAVPAADSHPHQAADGLQLPQRHLARLRGPHPLFLFAPASIRCRRGCDIPLL